MRESSWFDEVISNYEERFGALESSQKKMLLSLKNELAKIDNSSKNRTTVERIKSFFETDLDEHFKDENLKKNISYEIVW